MRYLGEVKELKETRKGTDLVIHVPKEYLQDAIERYRQGKLEIRIDDGRRVTADQRKRYYATLRDIANHTGNVTEDLHSYFKLRYLYEVEDKLISLSSCSVTEARKLINIQMDFVIKEGIPLTALGVERTDDINAYIYSCILNRVCACCGKKADIHHCTGSRIGMGNNRAKVNNVGRTVIAVCRSHHNEIHSIGEKEFYAEHKVYGIELDEFLVRKLKL